MKRTTAIAAALSLMPLGQPLIIGTGAVLTNVAIILSAPEKAQANPPLRKARDSQGRDMRFYINRGYKKAKEGDRRGAHSDYTTAINMHDRDPYGPDLINYQFALHFRGLNHGARGNYRAACSDFKKAARFGSKPAKREFLESCQ